jgi:DNA-binding response OmpR family regulator
MTTKVLIVEDDEEMNRLLTIDLERHDYEVHTAKNGLEGLKKFHDVRPNLVVLDVALPGMDGMTVCQRIRELSNVPILIMTAHAVTEEEMAGLDLGADEP